MSEQTNRALNGHGNAAEAMRSAISVPGRINAAVYRSVKQYLMPPVVKIVMLVLVAAYEAAMIYEAVVNKTYTNLILMVIMTAAIILLYRFNQNSNVKRIIKEHPELGREGYHVLITFADNIKLINHSTGAERNLAFADVVSMAETEQCIALFAKKRRYMLVPKNEMTDAQRDAVVSILQSRCPGMKKRR